MTNRFQRHTITAALPYANGPVHIGHLAGVYVPADIYVRYLRSKGEDVLFVCGSDEHGVPITIRAQKEGVSPQEVVDKYHAIIRDSFQQFGISFDVYSRTSAPVHHQTASEFFTNLHKKGVFEVKESEQYYDEQASQFLADRYIKGTCPNCGYNEAYGDQCERCGTSLSPSDLIDPRSMLSGAKPVLRTTTHWYLPLQDFEGWLRKWILEDHKEWKPNVYGQCKSWIDQGLQARAVTRDLDWGVPVPLPEAEGKVLYVWFDAPIGYISATKDWAERHGKDWRPYWQQEDTRLLHFIGKDNIVFHCIIFPAMLKAHGAYTLPENVPANEFLNLEGNKISTSRNWAVWLHEYLEAFTGKEDVLRYALTANAPETKDNDFTWKDFQAKNNNELVAILGNFVNRAMVLTHKYYEGKLPERGEIYSAEKEVLTQLSVLPGKVADALDNFRFREGLAAMMELARLGNKYLADTEPWKLIKENPERVKTIMNLSLQIAANLTIVAAPFLPHTAEKLRNMLQLPLLSWQEAGRDDLLPAGAQLNPAELLFQKIEDSVVEEQIQKLQNTKIANEAAAAPAGTLATPASEGAAEGTAAALAQAGNAPAAEVAPAKPEIVYDDFVKLDLRVGTVLSAEKMKKSKKLLKLLIDTGIDQRTILSGIAQHFEPEQLVGQQVMVLVNLAPRPMMGEESQGMVLLAEDASGKLVLVKPEAKVNNGSSIS
ncbi:methionine--tRNA ligase [Cesiribacter sp. SM1]|uniref:methionine--tRNA ligase n=1 Tax=Cesiribacter sp. SM1 TaxID=2861196 RepID=UPI001CD384E4|nr:methionine--tRNA ligase [Cesiribacter sp. SM1]